MMIIRLLDIFAGMTIEYLLETFTLLLSYCFTACHFSFVYRAHVIADDAKGYAISLFRLYKYNFDWEFLSLIDILHMRRI